MMFATGMGIGLVFSAVGEPLFFYMSPPPNTVDGSTAEAMGTSMGTTLFHWTLYPWAMYAIVGLGVAYGSFRLGRSQLFSSMFTPLFGERAVNGAGGKVINILAILATLFGSACSLGLGAIQIGGGIESAGIMSDVSSPILVIIIAILTAAFVASAVSGVAKGIQWLSNINMVLAIIIALIVFIGGPTLFILNVIPSSLGSFIQDLPQMASRTAANGQDVNTWLSSWTVFYWAWWVSWSPFVGLFIARISRGRTVRQFVLGVLIVPSVVSTIWFAIFGGGAIGIQERAERGEGTVKALAKIVDGEPDINMDTILFDLLGALPLPNAIAIILMVVTVILIAIFFVTGADSASIVMGTLSANGREEPGKGLVLFWGVATGAVAAVMLLAGGSDPAEALEGLKNITIVAALPFVIVMLLLCVAVWKDLSRDPLIIQGQLANHVLEQSVATAVNEYDGSVFGLETSELPAEDIENDSRRRYRHKPELTFRSPTVRGPGTAPNGAEPGPRSRSRLATAIFCVYGFDDRAEQHSATLGIPGQRDVARSTVRSAVSLATEEKHCHRNLVRSSRRWSGADYHRCHCPRCRILVSQHHRRRVAWRAGSVCRSDSRRRGSALA